MHMIVKSKCSRIVKKLVDNEKAPGRIVFTGCQSIYAVTIFSSTTFSSVSIRSILAPRAASFLWKFT
jgi:hypothetical protein